MITIIVIDIIHGGHAILLPTKNRLETLLVHFT